MKRAAVLISVIFHPLLLATWVVVLFGNLNKYAFGAAPVGRMTAVVFINTFFFPAITFLMMYFLDFIPDLKMRNKQDRTIPFFAAMTFYTWSFMVVRHLQMPVFLQLFVLGATITIAMAFIVNIFYKISLHMAGMGGVLMLLFLIVFTGAVDVGHVLITAVILTGLVGTARLKLGAHTLNELYFGLLIGLFGQMAGLLAYNYTGSL